ncbi:MAG: hypothetical protein IKW67_01295 [Alphaproteobacteria bacterium]|nr:hypothetical protein [Alphaproteobacteria bacterium]
MNILKRFFSNDTNQRGSMLVELLLTVALATVIIPFIFQYHQDSVTRAENIAIANQMTEIQVALERYITEHREELLKTVGRTITRVKLDELTEYGLPEYVLDQGDSKYQIRILKSADGITAATLQGVIVRDSEDITPLRTREIVGLSGGSMGFVDGTHAYGTFGAWHTDTVDLGIDINNGIIETTSVNRDNALYLWRIPSENADDAKMLSALNLGGHDIVNINSFNADHVEFAEELKANIIATRDLIFQTRVDIDKKFDATNAIVSGMLTSDGKNMEISSSLNVDSTIKLSSLTAENLWVSNLTLGGMSINAENEIATLNINQALDMTAGRIEAMFVTVGFTGSITPRLVVRNKIVDSVNSNYFWDMDEQIANFSDASFVELNRMATLATIREGDSNTKSGQIFGSVSTNKNATVADFMNALNEIETMVRAKYQNLHLQ